MESTDTLIRTPDHLRRARAILRLQATRRKLLAIMGEIDRPEMRGAHVAVGGAVAQLDDAIEELRS